jgi:metal-sulfur cluster biosynthetic enzyme
MPDQTPTLSLEAVYARLDEVYDPELDESITRLGFVEQVQLAGDRVTVVYRLPTFWCAANFAFMMAADIRSEVGKLAGVGQVVVELREHFADAEINNGINAGRSFVDTFPEEALGNLDELRRTFLEKAYMARQEVLISRLRNAGLHDEQVVALPLGALQTEGEAVLVAGPQPLLVRRAADDLRKYTQRRRSLGLPCAATAPLVLALDGTTVAAGELPAYLRRTRVARLNIAFNTSLCEGLLRTRYHPEQAGQHASLGDALLLTPVGR